MLFYVLTYVHSTLKFEEKVDFFEENTSITKTKKFIFRIFKNQSLYTFYIFQIHKRII